jgi:phage gp45-like
LGRFGWHARKVCSDGRLRQGWIAVIDCQVCTDTLISEKGQLDFNATRAEDAAAAGAHSGSN